MRRTKGEAQARKTDAPRRYSYRKKHDVVIGICEINAACDKFQRDRGEPVSVSHERAMKEAVAKSIEGRKEAKQ